MGKTIGAHIAYLGRPVRGPEARPDRFVEATEAYRARDEILPSTPGVGPQVSRPLPAHLPGLGPRARQTPAAPAPYNADSGTRAGCRHIGGRGAGSG